MAKRNDLTQTTEQPAFAPQHTGRVDARDTSVGYTEYLTRLQQAQKPGGGVPAYMRWVNRGAARRIAAASAVAGLTPNQVTAISATLTGVGLATLVIAPATWAVGAVVAVLLALGFAFDSADGQLARLTGKSGPAGEWLDHVVDVIRTPLVHLCVAAAVWLQRPEWLWIVPLAVVFAVLGTGQFTSQILAEQLVRNRGGESVEPDGKKKSFLLLPTDTGVLCWGFVLWGNPYLFAGLYSALFLAGLVHTSVSMRRKFHKLRAL